ncbi:MAG: alkaline phosphatase D family protein [Flavobacteriaceae bacterium]|nr:alkaline phosphatase D family protein [Flavobacteriaceae bacterium]
MLKLKKIFFTILLCSFFQIAYAQNPLLQSGPMVGYSEMKEVMLWVQTKEAASVQINYFEQSQPQQIFKTEIIETEKKSGFTAHLLADQVSPDKKYTYEVLINNKKQVFPYPLEFQTQVLWRYRTNPPTFKFALGSCVYINQPETDRPGKPYGGNYEIFNSIHQQKPDFMLWTGDNIYLREPDWNTWTGIIHRNTNTRSTPEMQPLLASSHNYAIWDDHDFGPNDADRSFTGKKLTTEAFKLFWANLNYGAGDTEGITGSFEWGDCQFFMMDNRYYKAPNDLKVADKPYYGEKQLKWLIDALTYSSATFKFIVSGGQVLNPATVFENYSNYSVERKQLLDAIKLNNISGVIFITGDRHHTELTKIGSMYDLTVSPLTSGAANPRDDENAFRIPGTLVKERNFATIEVKGTKQERILTIRVMDVSGKELWNKDIAAKDLKP